VSIFFLRFFTPAPLSVFLLPSFPAKFPKKENLKPIWIFYIRLLMNHAGMLFCLVFCLCPIYFNDFQLLCLCPTHSNISSHFAYVRFTPIFLHTLLMSDSLQLRFVFALISSGHHLFIFFWFLLSSLIVQ